jgi:hypothetical protein
MNNRIKYFDDENNCLDLIEKLKIVSKILEKSNIGDDLYSLECSEKLYKNFRETIFVISEVV